MSRESVDLIYDTFLGLPPEECTYEGSQVVMVQVPYDGTTSYMPGSRRGPAAILSASTQVEPYDHELGREPSDVGIHTLPGFLPSAEGPEALLAQVEAMCRPLVADGKFLFTLGGEHSVTQAPVRALYGGRSKEMSFLQIDAHLDLRHNYGGSRFSHACVGRRLLDYGRVVHVGARTACSEEISVIHEHGLDPIWGHEIAQQSDDRWIDRAVSQLSDEVYVTVDVDGIDPSVIPGTGTPVPGGLSWYQTLKLLAAVGASRKVVGCDLMELAPGPGDHRSAFAAAQLALKMVGYFLPAPLG